MAIPKGGQATLRVREEEDTQAEGEEAREGAVGTLKAGMRVRMGGVRECGGKADPSHSPREASALSSLSGTFT